MAFRPFVIAPFARGDDRASAPDCVTFAEPGNMIFLGARALEGMNPRVDALKKLLSISATANPLACL